MKYRGENKINEALHEEIAGAKIAQLCPPLPRPTFPHVVTFLRNVPIHKPI